MKNVFNIILIFFTCNSVFSQSIVGKYVYENQTIDFIDNSTIRFERQTIGSGVGIKYKGAGEYSIKNKKLIIKTNNIPDSLKNDYKVTGDLTTKDSIVVVLRGNVKRKNDIPMFFLDINKELIKSENAMRFIQDSISYIRLPRDVSYLEFVIDSYNKYIIHRLDIEGKHTLITLNEYIDRFNEDFVWKIKSISQDRIVIIDKYNYCDWPGLRSYIFHRKLYLEFKRK